jgi:regulator of PEP synthase PpsR (kinase-PPPase family)
VENVKRGRPKSKEPIRDKRLSIKVTAEELAEIQAICIKNDIRYIDVVKKGLEYWSTK